MVNKRVIIKASVSCDYECTKRFEGTVNDVKRILYSNENTIVRF